MSGPDLVAEVRERHVPSFWASQLCKDCSGRYPCDAIRLAKEIERLRKENYRDYTEHEDAEDDLREANRLVRENNERLREALKNINNAYPDAMCLRIARAALAPEPSTAGKEK